MKEASYHLTLLAQNRTGFQEPGQAGSAGVSRRLLFQAADRQGTARSPQRRDHLPERLRLGRVQPHAARRQHGRRSRLASRRWRSPPGSTQLFGDRYFIEIQNNGLEIQRLAMEAAVEVAKRMGLPLVATSDAHYVDREDAEAQDVLLCINTGKFRTDTNRMRMEGDQFFLRSPEEMYAAFPGPGRRRRAAARRSPTRSTSSWNSASGTFPTFTLPPETNRRRLPARAVRRGPEGALRRRRRDAGTDGELSPDVHRPARPRTGRHQQAGLLRTTS